LSNRSFKARNDLDVDAYHLSRYRVQKVGGAIHTEYWIPAEDLPEFNRNIVGQIKVTAEFREPTRAESSHD
jgi:hypothetical protein